MFVRLLRGLHKGTLSPIVLASALVLSTATESWALPLTYTFDFGGTAKLEFTVSDFVTTTGMFNISPTTETIGGITVTQVGTNIGGWWVIGDGNDSITDVGFIGVGAAIFLFIPNPTGFITAPGVVTFGGLATAGGINLVRPYTLTVTDAAAVPEPTSLTLMAFGLAGMGARRWRQRRA